MYLLFQDVDLTIVNKPGGNCLMIAIMAIFVFLEKSLPGAEITYKVRGRKKETLNRFDYLVYPTSPFLADINSSHNS